MPDRPDPWPGAAAIVALDELLTRLLDQLHAEMAARPADLPSVRARRAPADRLRAFARERLRAVRECSAAGMALSEYAPALERAAGLMSALANFHAPPDPGRPAGEGGDGTPAGPPPHPDMLRRREQAEEKLVALAGEYREVIQDLMILREHVSGRSPAGGVRQSSGAAEAVEHAPVPATPPPPLDTTPGYPPVEPERVEAAARDVPRAVRNMGNDDSPGATVPDRQNRIVRADVLVERVAELGHEQAAAAWAVHLLVGRGGLVPEVRKECVEVGERWVPDVEGVMAELYRTDWRHFDPPMKKVSGQLVEQPTWAGTGPVPFECLLVRSTPRLWAPAARPPAPPPGSRLSVSTRPRTVEPPGGRVEAAMRDLPGVLNNAPDAPGVTTQPGERAVVYHMLRSGLEKNAHQRDAAEWAIHRHVEAGRLLVEPGVVGLPAAVTAGRVVAGGGTGRTYDRELCLLRSTAALWHWWHEGEERAPVPVHPDHDRNGGAGEGVMSVPVPSTPLVPDDASTSTDEQHEGKTKGKNIDARMLKKLADDPVSANWSARQWADYLHCSAGTVKETKTWKERLKAARAIQAADAADRMDRANTKPKGQRKPGQ
jgi:hypothetical protein